MANDRLGWLWSAGPVRRAACPAELRALVLTCVGLIPAGCGGLENGQDVGTVRLLEPGRTIHAEIADGEHQRYRVVLGSGDVLRMLVDQHDADLVVRVLPPDGEPVLEVDARARGVESVTLVASRGGEFALTVRPAAPVREAAAYALRLDGPPRRATDRDHQWARAERLTTEARILFGEADGGSRQRTLDLLRELPPQWRQLGDLAGEATTLAMVGDVHHANGNLDAAEAAYRQALEPSRKAGDRRQLAELVNNLGVLDWRRARLTEATAHYHVALEHWRSLPFPAGEAATLTNQGTLFFEAGEYQQALDRFLAALAIFEAEHDARGEAYALNNLGVTYRALGDLDGALRSLDRAVRRFHAAQEVAGEGRAHLRLSRIHMDRGDLARAEASVVEALVLIRRADDRFGEADALDLAGTIAAASGDPRKALSHHEDARVRYEQMSGRRGEATARHHAGAALLAMGEPARALVSLSQALAIRREVGLRDAEADTLHQMALAERQRGRGQRARSYLTQALAITEDVRGRVAGEYSRVSYFSSRRSYFAAQIDLLMDLYARTRVHAYAAEAFETSERERARSLLDTLGATGTEIRRGVDLALLERERVLRREMNVWSYRLAGLADRAGADAQLVEARQALAERVDEYRRLAARIHAASPGYAALVIPAALGIAQLQREVIDTDTALLRFALGERRSYLWVVTRDSLRVVTLPDEKTIDRAARRMYELLSTPPGEPDAARARQLGTATSELSAMLLGPVASDLAEHRLLIVAEGMLQLMPFAALREPGGELPLVARHEIVLLPSGTTLAVLRRMQAGREPARRTLALLADPVYERDDPRLGGRRLTNAQPPQHASTGSPLSFTRLPFSALEGKWIASLLPASEVLFASGFAASRETVTSPALRDYRIVHIAAHAVLDDEHPELSGIALSLVDEAGTPRDGFLRLHEIHGLLDLRADLVVTSACDTARGRDLAGEGLVSLARGWFAAGVPRVVATLYGVQDAATAQLMRAFYEGMLGPERLSPPAALRAAQLSLLAEPQWQDPHYWSGFVFLGEPG